MKCVITYWRLPADGNHRATTSIEATLPPPQDPRFVLEAALADLESMQNAQYAEVKTDTGERWVIKTSTGKETPYRSVAP